MPRPVVVRHHQRAGGGDPEPRAQRDAGSLELGDLLQHGGGGEDDTVADEDVDVGPQHPGGNEPQHRLLAVDHQRMSGVVAALEAHDALRVPGQPVHDLALALIAPLRADDDDVLPHGSLEPSRIR
jgi:hypothetical protein